MFLAYSERPMGEEPEHIPVNGPFTGVFWSVFIYMMTMTAATAIFWML